ncbi:conserved hypothetical protein [Candidatus Desulfosporosinus infrequens]|uniref:Uncharacterized protein n=1 Tax=Candidatus Desulfosporosinus infrequens TaxID=2043169 RepID=A0A2U3LYE3_9FIRM|nr:conserved hypothetical protein [Candidatus Desulfosporosinus infrequens]
MVRCSLFIPTELECTKACTNCKRWNGKKCKDEQQLREMYEESEEFKIYDQMMRGNRGVYLI